MIIELCKCLSPHYTCGDTNPGVQMVTRGKVQLPFLGVVGQGGSEGEILDNTSDACVCVSV